MNNPYATGAGGFFAMIAREPRIPFPLAVRCRNPKCQSRDTKPLDEQFTLIECVNCGAVFERNENVGSSDRMDG